MIPKEFYYNYDDDNDYVAGNRSKNKKRIIQPAKKTRVDEILEEFNKNNNEANNNYYNNNDGKPQLSAKDGFSSMPSSGSGSSSDSSTTKPKMIAKWRSRSFSMIEQQQGQGGQGGQDEKSLLRDEPDRDSILRWLKQPKQHSVFVQDNRSM